MLSAGEGHVPGFFFFPIHSAVAHSKHTLLRREGTEASFLQLLFYIVH